MGFLMVGLMLMGMGKRSPVADNKTISKKDKQAPYNIIFVIADDMGVDVSSQYPYGGESVAHTPFLDGLAKEGIVFDQFWATPACTTTRGAAISGQHGFENTIDYVPALMPEDTLTIQQVLKKLNVSKGYQTGLFGKWHLGGPSPKPKHPNSFGIDHYVGNLFNLKNYFEWNLTKNGIQTQSTVYHTSKITLQAKAWIKKTFKQGHPFFAWVAYSAPHKPFHAAPAEYLEKHKYPQTDQERYFSMVEAMDFHIESLLSSLSKKVRDQTIVVFVGDNGTPKRVINTHVFNKGKGKGTLYEGGIRTPLIVGGMPIKNKGTRSQALVNVTDFYATFLSLAQPNHGLDVPKNSFDFSDLLLEGAAQNKRRSYNYTEFRKRKDQTSWTVRNSRYKYIFLGDGSEALYEIADIREVKNIISDPKYKNVLSELKNHGQALRSGITGQPKFLRTQVLHHKKQSSGFKSTMAYY